jgi:hypothetical protein
MIDYVQSIVRPSANVVSTQTATFLLPVTQGNLIAIVGTYTLSPGSVVLVVDSLANIYAIDEPLSDSLGNSYWFVYAVSQSTGNVTVTIDYSTSVNSSSFTAMEFFNSIGWVNPPQPDGLSFNTGNGTTLSSSPLTTTNADDLLIALSNATTGSTVSSAWSFIAQQSATRSVWWMEAIPSGVAPAFSATQTVSGSWAVETWALQANLVAANSLTILTAVVNPTAFVEAYQNRIKEDIYDSLEGQPTFHYVQYGPSFLNG